MSVNDESARCGTRPNLWEHSGHGPAGPVEQHWGIFVVPGIPLVAILVFPPYRVEKHSPPATALPGAEPTADLSGALTVDPGGNLTEEPSSTTFTVVCDQAELTIACNGNSGHCAHLIVRGSRNKVVADNPDAIDTDGSANQVIYHGGAPQISVGEPTTSSGRAETAWATWGGPICGELIEREMTPH